jgi:hypothetical protein
MLRVMPVIAIAPLERSAAAAFAAAWGLPLVYDEVVERLAGRLGLRRDRVERLLDGSAGLLERLTVDRVSLSLLSAEEIVARAARGAAAVMPAWGAFRLLRGVPEVVCLRRRDAFAQPPASRQHLADLALALRVRAALRLSAPTRGLCIAVSAESGHVRLEGIVPSGAQRGDAGEVAAGVAGVRGLENLLRLIDSLRPRFT